MATKYTYSKSGDFTSGLADEQFIDEVEADPGIAPTCTHVNKDDDVVDVWFDAALSAGEQTTLTGLVAAHVPFTPATAVMDSDGANNTTMMIMASQTANRTLYLPDGDDTLVCLAGAQTLTNKTIDTATNTLTIAAGDVTSGTFADARIAASSVTQHQGSIDHGTLVGLADDDHSQYALLAGRAGGQTFAGGTLAGQDLILESTAHSTQGSVVIGKNLYATSYACSIQKNDAYSYLEILNNGGTNKGAFFGMETNDFALYNWQAGPILFYTDTVASSGNVRMTVEAGGNVRVHNLGTGVVKSNASGVLSHEATNTGFNLALGTTAGTVAAGNHIHNASAITAGTLGVARGGTGATTHTTNAILKGNGTGAVLSSSVLIDGSNNITGINYMQLKDVSTPANPGAGLGRLYKKTGDDGLFWKPDAAGSEVDLTGDASGPGSSTDNAVVRFDGTSGKILQNSAVTIDDNGVIDGTRTITPAASITWNLGSATKKWNWIYGLRTVLDDGTAAQPSFSFNGDPDCGMYSTGVNEISFATGGTQRLKIESDGTVGVTTASYETLVTANNDVPNKKYVDDKTWATSDIVSGTFANARIAASNVTQHEASITHDNLTGAGTNTHAQIDSHIAATAAHGATGAVVGTTNAQTLTNKTLTNTTNNVAAKSLHSTTTVIDVASATAPTSGQVLTATSGTAATWQSATDGDVTAAANLAASGLVVGDDGVKGVKTSSNWTLDSNGVLMADSVSYAGYILDCHNTLSTGGGNGFRIKAGEALGDIAFHIADTDDTFQIMEMEADQGYITMGKTYAQTLADNGVVYGLDIQHTGAATDFNTQVGTYRIGGVDIVPVRIGHTWGISGEIKVASGDTDFLNPFFISLATGKNAKIVKARYKINSGTSATVKLQKNDVDVTGFTGLSATTTATTTDPADVALTEDDKLALVVTAVAGTPKNLSFTLFIEYTA